MTDPHEPSGKGIATILVAVVDGLTTLPGESSTGRITQALSRCMENMEQVIQLFGGRVDRFAGEKMITFFGIPDSMENFPVQAVQAAIEMRNRLELMVADRELPEGIGLRTGIATGEVISGLVGTGKNKHYTVIGAAAELATRIQDLAERGQILIGPETYRQTREQFELRSLEPIPVKGQKQPVQIFEVHSRKKDKIAASPESARMIVSPMVGRQKELDLLETQIMRLIVNGKGCVVTITGEAGVGKSRLMAEFRKREAIGQVAFFEGKGMSFGSKLSYHPITQVIRSWAGIAEDDPILTAHAKLDSNIRRVYPDGAEEIFPFVATMMGYPLTGPALERVKGIEGEALEKLILKNLRELLGEAVRRRPGFIVIEDMHWADLSTIHALEFLVKLVRTHRLVFVFIFRPGYEETGGRIRTFIAENLPEQTVNIDIVNLDQAQSVELVANLINQLDLPQDVMQLIQEKSRGNPFFIEEILRSFIDQEIIRLNEGRFEMTDRIRYANIPETINEVLLSRIDRLDEKTRSLLKMASVIGRNFYYKVLEEAAETIGELDDKLGYLKDIQFINEGRKSDEIEYLFKHALAQQATYESIMQKTRREMHLKIARSIEKVFANKIHEFYGVLAMHYGKAEIPEKREEYLIKAGEQSLLSGASSEAISYFKEALGCCMNSGQAGRDPVKVAMLQEKLAVALQTKGENIEAIEYFDKVLDYYHFKMSKNLLVRKIKAYIYFLAFPIVVKYEHLLPRKDPHEAVGRIIHLLMLKGDALATINPSRFFIESIQGFRLMLKYRVGSLEQVGGLLSGSSSFYIWTGISIKAGGILLRKADKVLEGKNIYYYYSYRMARKMYDYAAGLWGEDMDLEDVYRNALRTGAIWDIGIYIVYCGLIFIDKGQWSRLRDMVSKLSEVSENFENSHARAQAYRLEAVNRVRCRDLNAGIEACEEGIRFTVKTGHMAMLLVIWSQKSIMHSIRGECEEARKALLEAESLVKERKIIKLYLSGYLLAASCLEYAELNRDAEQRKQKITNLLRLTGKLIKASKHVFSNLTEAYRLRALAYWHLNRQSKAFRNFEKALEISEQHGARPEFARTCFEVGKCLMESKSQRNIVLSKNGSEYLLMGKSMFQELGLKWDMKQYEKYMGI
jgi:class 3 adenylate cyclase/tetratricopeptide (TPR) repeat protein